MKIQGRKFTDDFNRDETSTKPVVGLYVDQKRYALLAKVILDSIERIDDRKVVISDPFATPITTARETAGFEKILRNVDQISTRKRLIDFNRIFTVWCGGGGILQHPTHKLKVVNINMLEFILIYKVLMLINEINSNNDKYLPGYIQSDKYHEAIDEIFTILDSIRYYRNSDILNYINDKYINRMNDILNSIMTNPKEIKTSLFSTFLIKSKKNKGKGASYLDDLGLSAYSSGFCKTMVSNGIYAMEVNLKSIKTKPEDTYIKLYVKDNGNTDGHSINSDKSSSLEEIDDLFNSENFSKPEILCLEEIDKLLNSENFHTPEFFRIRINNKRR